MNSFHLSGTLSSWKIGATIKPFAENFYKCLKKSSERWQSAKEISEAIARQRKTGAI